MEAKENETVISFDEYKELYRCKESLRIAEDVIKKTMDKDGGLRLPPKCVQMLLKIMEE